MIYDSVSQRKNILLNMINHLGPISRTALIELTDFRPATVGAIASELIAEKLIVETENVSVGHGRKRVLLDINKKHICAVGISFAPKHATLIVSQFDGTIIYTNQLDLNAANPTNEQILMIAQNLKDILEKFSDKNLVGIGLCKFLFDATGFTSATNTWINERLIPEINKITSLPIRLFSEVTLPAVSEHRYGIAQDVNNFIWVNLTDSITASLFCDGVAISGGNQAAGMLGHMSVEHNSSKLCYCGKPGCVESTSAWPALAAEIRNALHDGVHTCLCSSGATADDFTFVDVRKALDADDRMCKHYVKAAAHRIGLALANVVNLLNPEMIVLHGFMLRLGKQFTVELENTVRDNIIPVAGDVRIEISNDFENPMLLGAVAELFSTYLHTEDYHWIYKLVAESNT